MLLNHRDPWLCQESVHATVGESLEPNAVAMLSCGKSQPGRARSRIRIGHACAMTSGGLGASPRREGWSKTACCLEPGERLLPPQTSPPNHRNITTPYPKHHHLIHNHHPNTQSSPSFSSLTDTPRSNPYPAMRAEARSAIHTPHH